MHTVTYEISQLLYVGASDGDRTKTKGLTKRSLLEKPGKGLKTEGVGCNGDQGEFVRAGRSPKAVKPRGLDTVPHVEDALKKKGNKGKEFGANRRVTGKA